MLTFERLLTGRFGMTNSGSPVGLVEARREASVETVSETARLRGAAETFGAETRGTCAITRTRAVTSVEHVHDDEDATVPSAIRRVGMDRPLLDFERLDVYRCAIEFLALAVRIASRIPRGHADLRDQLRRASTSIPLNIAEASGKTRGPDRARFHAIARGSALECAAILDVLRLLDATTTDDATRGKLLLSRVVAMLSKMCR
jgi:four helix bundle protein